MTFLDGKAVLDVDGGEIVRSIVSVDLMAKPLFSMLMKAVYVC